MPAADGAAAAAPISPGEGLDPAWVGRLPLGTRGRHVVDAGGERFRLRAVNWYGASDCYHVVGGLDVQCLEVICESIQSLGFNAVRLPFSNEMLRSQVPKGVINFEKNPGLLGLTALEVFDEVIRCLGRHSLAVILNNHTTYGDWCMGPDRNGMWFAPGSREYTTERWTDDWAMLARRYRDCPQVVGADLRNEVRFCPWPFRWPSLSSGLLARLALGRSWTEAAASCAEQVLGQNKNLLVIVERVVWPARSLAPYAAEPGPLLPKLRGRLVLGVHHYAWSGPGRYLAFSHTMTRGCAALAKHVLRALRIFSRENYGDMTSAGMMKQLFCEWGFLLEAQTCPVWVSEFGSNLGEDRYDFQWFKHFVECLGALDADFAYWPLNVGPKPGSGHGEPYGLLAEDWTPKAETDPRLALMRAQHLLPPPAA